MAFGGGIHGVTRGNGVWRRRKRGDPYLSPGVKIEDLVQYLLILRYIGVCVDARLCRSLGGESILL